MSRALPDASVAIVAEKPSVARDIARVVGASQRGDGYLFGDGHIVTWAVGHLVRLPQPHEIHPEWKAWRRDRLPMLPTQWPLQVIDQTSDQFRIVRQILQSPSVERVICATDAGREGELIFRYLYEAAGANKPVSRLWVSSLTGDAIRKGLSAAKPASEYDSLADAARGRSRADWLVGMNLSRAYSLATDEQLSVGRVQTPTLAMVVDRELEIRAFIPEDYFEVEATFSPAMPDKYTGTWFRADPEGKLAPTAAMRLPADGKEAEAVVARAKSGQARIESLKSETQRMAPPLLYDLTELQRHANRLFSFTAQKTLDLAQALYEKHKLISYPRTDSRHLSTDVAKTLPRIVSTIRGAYEAHIAPGTGERPLNRRYVDDSRVTDHHAIIPTHTPPDQADLGSDERRIYDLICRRLLSAWHGDYVTAVTTVITRIDNPEVIDRYHSTGTIVVEPGWKVLDLAPEKKKKVSGKDADAGGEAASQTLPTSLAENQPQNVLDARALRKKTRPPRRFTEGTLLTAMETAGKTLDEKELADAMKDSGLGTPATRANIIEVLLQRAYIERDGKSLKATDKGIRLIELVHPEVKSPAMTGQWEARLHRIHTAGEPLSPFLTGIENYVREVVGKALSGGPRLIKNAPTSAPARQPSQANTNASVATAAAPAPATRSNQTIVTPTDDLTGLLRERFGFPSFREHQENVCRVLLKGEDALLVMPTGAGKSLCYQLPGIARGGTTLVISPLIALMEDQVSKLRGYGFRAETIHSGRDRATSRQICIDYLHGALDFLFIAPERLRVQGFPEMLAKRKPSLIAIDEAHCISQWGHDFRPDYRRIGEHLPMFRPVPVLALTATATGIVQKDIAEQLGLQGPNRFIHGFRRSNIAVEVIECTPSRRFDMVEEILNESSRRPAIVYTPTRKDAESLAHQLSFSYPAEAYHAGLDPRRREEVQKAFLESRLQVTVATIAFGMGIDKSDIRTVIHTALPGSIEAYYQEIGRAGRDGLPSRAILLQSYADRRTHDYFFERDYPESEVLAALATKTGTDPIPKDLLRHKIRLDMETFDIALEKLWIHGGVFIDAEENVTRGSDSWRESYEQQRAYRQEQLGHVLRYAESGQCRMLTLVNHFNDRGDSGKPCGICDFCAPDESRAHSFRPPRKSEEEMAAKIALMLEPLKSGTSTGKLFMELASGSTLERRDFERLLAGMARSGLLTLTPEVFEKDGRRINFTRAVLTDTAREAEAGEPLKFEVSEPFAAERKLRTRKKRTSASSKTQPAGTKKKTKAPPAPDQKLFEALKQWRLKEARRLGVPAFRVFPDQTLQSIAAEQPATLAQLIAISGITLRKAEQYGKAIFHILDTN